MRTELREPLPMNPNHALTVHGESSGATPAYASPGRAFYALASRPLWVMGEELQRSGAAAALPAVGRERLDTALSDGTVAAARSLGLEPAVVRGQLPLVEIHATFDATLAAHANAVAVFEQHGGVGALVSSVVGGVADAHLGQLGIGQWLASTANRVLRDARMKEPMTALILALQTYDQILVRCAAVIDAMAPRLGPPPRRTRRAPLVVVGVSVVASLSAAAGWWLYGRSGASTSDGLADASAAALTSTATATATAPGSMPSPSTHATGRVPDTTAGRRAPAPKSSTPPSASATAAAPVTRAACIQACVGKCADDSTCERSCARSCPGS